MIPVTNYYPGGSFSSVDDAFSSSLIGCANFWISNIATDYSSYANTANQDFNAMAEQLTLNVTNCIAAGIDIANVVNDMANANLIANNQVSTLSLVGQLQDIGLDVTQGGAAQ